MDFFLVNFPSVDPQYKFCPLRLLRNPSSYFFDICGKLCYFFTSITWLYSMIAERILVLDMYRAIKWALLLWDTCDQGPHCNAISPIMHLSVCFVCMHEYWQTQKLRVCSGSINGRALLYKCCCWYSSVSLSRVNDICP